MAQNPVVTFEMEDGSIIKAELYPEVAPNTVNNFISLVKKGYVTRERGKEDRRVVYISLSEKGRNAYQYHEKFHHDMIDAILQDLTSAETESLVSALAKLNLWFREAKG